MAFERIPLGWKYETLKPYFNGKTDMLNKPNERTLAEAVDVSMDFFFEGYIEENGMKRVALVIMAFLYEIEHGEVDADLAKAVKWHIEDFETGEYDDLFPEEDLKALKEDMQTAKDYIEAHPELLN